MQVDFDRLSRYHDEGKLRHSVHPSRNLHVWTYSQSTVYNRDWDDLTRICRGLVTDGDGVVISRPFPKFFNWGEPEAPGSDITSKPFWAYDKMDGTLIIVGLDSNGDRVVSTKGSFTTWHSEMADRLLEGFTPVPNSTAVFELIGPSNQIVCKYAEDELVLLGAVAHADGCDHFTPEDYAEESGWYGSIVPPRAFSLQAMLRTVQDPENGENREGFVLVWPNPEGPSHRVKIKFSQYVMLHAMLSRINNVSIWEALRDHTFETLLDLVPDEIYNEVRECADELNAKFLSVRSQCLMQAKAAEHYPTRREVAEHVLKSTEHPGIVFGLMDGKDVSRKIWDVVKPERDQKWQFLK